MSEELFYENVERWADTHPKEAVLLQYLSVETVEPLQTESGEYNLCKKNSKGTFNLYTHDSPKEEAKQWFDALSLEGVDVLYVYGVGLGAYYEVIKEWLNGSPSRYVVFLEDDLEVIYAFFHTECAQQLLQDPKAELFFVQTVAETDALFKQLFWQFARLRFECTALKAYAENKKMQCKELFHRVRYDAALNNSLVEEYLEYGIVFFKNYYTNMRSIGKAYLGNALFGQFKKVPAIICGAGPSLQKNIATLKTLKKHALIFAGSSSLNALAAEGISPNLGAGIDPNPMQEKRLKQIKPLNFPFFYRSRIYPDALKCIEGPKLYMTGAGGYDIAEWFDQELGIEGELLEEGRNVVNFSLEVAYRMGCDPIIFVGMDLAHTNGLVYAKGIEDDQAHQEETIERIDIEGNPVLTLWKWVSEAQWIADFAKEHPEITVINATEGGLGFPNVPNLTLKDVAKQYLEKEEDPTKHLKAVIEKHPLKEIADARLEGAFRKLEESLVKTLTLIKGLREENRKVIARFEKEGKVEYFHTGQGVLLEQALEQEPAYLHVLHVFNDVYTNLLTRRLRLLQAKKEEIGKQEVEKEKLLLTQEKLAFLYDVADYNLQLLRLSLSAESE